MNFNFPLGSLIFIFQLSGLSIIWSIQPNSHESGYTKFDCIKVVGARVNVILCPLLCLMSSEFGGQLSSSMMIWYMERIDKDQITTARR